MGKKPKARSPAKRPADAAKKAKKSAQSERFIKAARSIGVDETGQEFERAIQKMFKPKRSRVR
jgi:hypothetical protein